MTTAAARTATLAALRRNLAAAPLVPPPEPELPASEPVGPDAWNRLAGLYRPLGVHLHLAATPEAAAKTVADLASERGITSYVRWPELPPGLAAACDAALSGLERLDPAKRADLARAGMGLTGALAALLDSGSLVLAAARDRERAVSLLPPVHVCLLPRGGLVPDIAALPGLIRSLAGPSGLPSCVNLVTGPSSTGDIECTIVRGVHGPGVLEVVGLDWG